MNKILIDGSHCRTGGGIQVARAFIFDLIKMNKAKKYTLYLSIELKNAIEMSDVSALGKFYDVRLNKLPIIIEIFRNYIWFQSFDLVFCIFGPAYFLKKPKKLITGFARPNLVYSFTGAKTNLFISLFQKIKNIVHEYYFLKSDQLIVETNHIKNLLIEKYSSKFNLNIKVVNNQLSDAFINSNESKNLKINNLDLDGYNIRFVYVGANYKHKNLNILGEVFHKIRIENNIKITLVLTMSNSDYDLLGDLTKQFCQNIGYAKPEDLQYLYKKIDAMIFPSLLECFSISPIEAMYCKIPILCSDRVFIREFCNDVPFYFEPNDINSIKRSILQFQKQRQNLYSRLNKGKKLSELYSCSTKRSLSYLELLKLPKYK